MLGDRAIGRVTRAAGRAKLETARLQAIGGSAWNVTGGSGTGIGAHPTATSYGTVTGWVGQSNISARQQSSVKPGAGALLVIDTQWRMVAAADQIASDATADGLRAGRTLRSVADSTLAFTVVEVHVEVGVAVATLERVP